MTKKLGNIQIALVHDFILKERGAERVLETLLSLFPNADVYSLFGNTKNFKTLKRIKSKRINYSFINKIPFIRTLYRYTYFLWPIAIEQFDLSNYDLVISNSFSVAKGIIPSSKTYHVSLVQSPMRYAWDLYQSYFDSFSFWKRPIIALFVHYIRIWDIQSFNRPDKIIANSKFISRRIQRYYGSQPAAIIYPPVYIPKEIKVKKGNYFLSLGALEPNKGILETVMSAKKYGFELFICGNGSLLSRAKKIARGCKNIRFLGWVNEKEKYKILARAKASILPSVEDFGIVAVESLACKTPVITLRNSGSAEIISSSNLGVLLNENTPENIYEAVKKIERTTYPYSKMRKESLKYSEEIFKKQLLRFLERNIPF